MTFFIFACQCMSTVAALKRETRSWRWPLFVLGYTYALAFVAAAIVYNVSGWFAR
jgi:ferrous iron transport protein B